MIDDSNRIREIVERATAAGVRLPDDLDAETASLRRSWLQLGKLIEQDMQSGDTPSGGANVDMEQAGAELATFGHLLSARPNRPGAVDACVENPGDGLAAEASIDSRGRRRGWSLVLMTAAASLLIGVGAPLALRHFAEPLAHQQADPPSVASNGNPAKPPIGPAGVPALERAPRFEPGSLMVAADRLQWDNSVSNGIAVVSRATMALAVPISLF